MLGVIQYETVTETSYYTFQENTHGSSHYSKITNLIHQFTHFEDYKTDTVDPKMCFELVRRLFKNIKRPKISFW